MSVKYAVIFEKAENNWAAYVPDLPGCVSPGQTLEQTELNIREAIQGHLRTLREFGEAVPAPATVARVDRRRKDGETESSNPCVRSVTERPAKAGPALDKNQLQCVRNATPRRG
jgi:predicted RNase H-like HicB family nuclease